MPGPGRELFKLFGLISMGGVEKTKKQLSEIDKQTRKAQKSIDRFGRKVADTGKALTKAFTLPLAVAGGVIAKFGIEFEAAMVKSTAIMGDLSDSMTRDMKKAALEISKTTKASATDAAEAYFFLASAGLNAAQSIEALPLVARFAQAGAFDLALATDLLTDAQSALGLSSDDTAEAMENMARVSDVLVKANTLANATVQQFSEALTNKAGAALRVLGKDVEEGAAVLAVFADQGLKGAAAGEALNIVLRDFQRANIKNKKAFEDAGVAVFDASGEMRGMSEVIQDLDEHLAGMSDEQRRAALSTLGFQDKSISATMALLGTADAIDKYEKGLRGAAGTTDDVAKKQLASFAAQLGLLKDRAIALAISLWEDLGPGITDVVIPAFNAVISTAERLVEGWRNLNPITKDLAKTFVLVAAAVGPVVFIIGKLIVLTKMLIPLMVALKMGTLSYAGAVAVLQKSILAWTIIIGTLIALGWHWYSQWDKMLAAIGALWQNILLVIKRAVNSMAQTLADGLLSVLNVVGAVAKVIPGLEDKINKAKIAILKFQASMFRMVAEQRIATTAAMDQGVALDSLGDTMKKIVEKGKDLIGLDKEATETAKEKGKVKAKLAEDELKQQQEIEETRRQFDERTLNDFEQLTLTKMELLLKERDARIAMAEQIGADVFAVEKLYALKEAELKEKLRQEEEKKERDAIKTRLRETGRMFNKLNRVIGMFSDNKLARLDREEQRQIKAIQNSEMSEEDKADAIARIEEDTEKKRQKIEKQRAIREKAAALFNIAINTASAVVEALPNIPLSVFVGALGVAEGIAVASAPLPFQEGGLVTGSAEGVGAIVGERNTDELVFPLERGIGLLVDAFIDKLSQIEIPAFGLGPALAAGAPGVGRTTVNLNIGTFIGDRQGLKQLERRLETIRIAENQRKGF